MSRCRLLFGLAILLLWGLAASNANAATVTVNIMGSTANGPFTFSPRVVVINAGDTVHWVYAGGTMDHNVVSDDGSTFTSGPATVSAFTFDHTFGSAGTFPYHCEPHEDLGMKGIVYVANRTARSENVTAYTLGAWDFEGTDNTAVTGSTEPFTRTITAGTTQLRAGVPLPSGARITGLEVAGCDAATGSVTATLSECIDPPGSSPVGICTAIAIATLGGDACGFASSSALDWVADNIGYSYHVAVGLPTTSHRLRSVRVFYTRSGGGTVYVPITPCRIIDTRSGGGQLVAGQDRQFNVVGSGDFSSQGGSASGCGIPGYSGSTPTVRAVMFNFVAASAAGAGNLRAWPADQSMPNASILNYAAIGMNIANGIALPVSQDSSPGNDLSVRASASNTHLIVDVVGYFVDPTP